MIIFYVGLFAIICDTMSSYSTFSALGGYHATSESARIYAACSAQLAQGSYTKEQVSEIVETAQIAARKAHLTDFENQSSKCRLAHIRSEQSKARAHPGFLGSEIDKPWEAGYSYPVDAIAHAIYAKYSAFSNGYGVCDWNVVRDEIRAAQAAERSKTSRSASDSLLSASDSPSSASDSSSPASDSSSPASDSSSPASDSSSPASDSSSPDSDSSSPASDSLPPVTPSADCYVSHLFL
jgi:hypothetical protein